MGSRSLQHGGAAVNKAAVELVEKAQKLAADLLEADEADIVLDKDAGAFHVAGTPAVSQDVGRARRRRRSRRRSADDRHRLQRQRRRRSRSVPTSPSSRSTPRPARCGTSATSPATTPARVLNPLLLEGQIHGGIAQGTAQALLEEVRYDDDGNPITSNLADYAMISAAELPSFEVVHMETPTFVNPLGAKGIGEIGHDRLARPPCSPPSSTRVSHLGVRHIDMPATAERVWRAIQAAG